MIFPVALIGLAWRWAGRADKAENEALMRSRRGSERTRT